MPRSVARRVFRDLPRSRRWLGRNASKARLCHATDLRPELPDRGFLEAQHPFQAGFGRLALTLLEGRRGHGPRNKRDGGAPDKTAAHHTGDRFHPVVTGRAPRVTTHNPKLLITCNDCFPGGALPPCASFLPGSLLTILSPIGAAVAPSPLPGRRSAPGHLAHGGSAGWGGPWPRQGHVGPWRQAFTPPRSKWPGTPVRTRM